MIGEEKVEWKVEEISDGRHGLFRKGIIVFVGSMDECKARWKFIVELESSTRLVDDLRLKEAIYR